MVDTTESPERPGGHRLETLEFDCILLHFYLSFYQRIVRCREPTVKFLSIYCKNLYHRTWIDILPYKVNNMLSIKVKGFCVSILQAVTYLQQYRKGISCQPFEKWLLLLFNEKNLPTQKLFTNFLSIIRQQFDLLKNLSRNIT